MKTITPTPTPTTFFLPADDLRAAFQCISAEESRHYLRGVLVEAETLVGLDGHQMLTVRLPGGHHVGAECFTQGMDDPQMPGATGAPERAAFILSCDAADKAFRAKTPGGELWVYGDTKTGIMQFVINDGTGGAMTRVGVLEFEVIDGTFPDWRFVVAKGESGSASMCFNPVVLGKMVKAADVFCKGSGIRLTGGKSASDPMRVEFVACDRLRGTLMPMKWMGA
jgi:hypothetical protein